MREIDDMPDRELLVHRASSDDVFSDIVRIPEAYRMSSCGEFIRNGALIRIAHKGHKVFAIVRGLECLDPVVQMDEFIRERLCIKPGEKVNRGGIRLAKLYEKPFWLLFATNPAVHVSAWLAAISIGLGVLSIILAFSLS